MSNLASAVAESAFGRLSRAGQTARLRRLAEKALLAWDVEPTRLLRLAAGFNVTMRVDTRDGQRFVLRIHRADGPGPAMVAAELDWLSALRRETSLAVPDPVPTRDGALTTVAELAGVPEPRTCDLLRWQTGRFLDAGLTPAHLFLVGELTARLQRHGRHHLRPAGFSRPRVDEVTTFSRTQNDNLSDDVGQQAAELVATSGFIAGAETVRAVIGRSRLIRDEIRASTDGFGLIHADLHQENYFFTGRSICVIDFDDCGDGLHLYDLAVSCSEIQHRPDYAALRSSLLAGYRSVQPLPAAHEGHLDALVAFRFLQLMLYRVEHRSEPMFRHSWQDDVAGNLRLLARYVARF